MNKPMNKIVALSLALLTPALAGGAGNPDEAAIRRSYQDLMRATVAGDSATILRFYAPKFSGYGPRYEPITREMLTARAPGLTFKSAQVTALKLVRQGQTYNVTAQVRSEGEYDLGGQKMPVVQTGETLDTWQKLGGRWQIVDSRAPAFAQAGQPVRHRSGRPRLSDAAGSGPLDWRRRGEPRHSRTFRAQGADF